MLSLFIGLRIPISSAGGNSCLDDASPHWAVREREQPLLIRFVDYDDGDPQGVAIPADDGSPGSVSISRCAQLRMPVIMTMAARERGGRDATKEYHPQ
jgi:hypothetical protein